MRRRGGSEPSRQGNCSTARTIATVKGYGPRDACLPYCHLSCGCDVSALWQAVCIARKYLQDDRIDVGFSPAFVDITDTDESGLGAV